MGVLHAVQGAAILVLATSFTLPIVTYPLTGPPGSPTETITLFDLRIAWAVAGSCSSTVDHLVLHRARLPYVRGCSCATDVTAGRVTREWSLWRS